MQPVSAMHGRLHAIRDSSTDSFPLRLCLACLKVLQPAENAAMASGTVRLFHVPFGDTELLRNGIVEGDLISGDLGPGQAFHTRNRPLL